MRITCFGAAGEVTGSAYWLRTDQASVLFDCGMFQGSRVSEKKNRVPNGLEVARLNSVVLTHAHLDHTGRLPLLAKAGYRGPIYSTPATIDFTGLILKDAASLQVQEAERRARKLVRAGRPPQEPLYTPDDVKRTLPLLRAMPYEQPTEVAPGVTVRAVDAGHMLGSASLTVKIREGAGEKTVVFSGDIGPRGAAILRDPVVFDHAQAVFLESTYGDRDHKPLPETLKELGDILEKVIARRGKILVPVFAVGRTQQLLYHLAEMFRTRRLRPFPIYLDSPMAIEANKLYSKHQDLFDEEATTLAQTGRLVTDLATVNTCPTAEDSRRLNNLQGPMLVMAGSGMCSGGRILHHLRNNLWKPDCAVLIVGYQGEGSLGRLLVDGYETVRIFGEPVAVKASIHTLGGFSAHAGQTELLNWLRPLVPGGPRVFLTHGEDRARLPFKGLIEQQLKLKVHLPRYEESVEV